ncbi:hypothetical protein AMTRI_Chr07g74590 [Amborella trichopoda]
MGLPFWFESRHRTMLRNRFWLGFPKSQGLLVGGNHTSSRKWLALMENVAFAMARRALLRALPLLMVTAMVPILRYLHEVEPIDLFVYFKDCGRETRYFHEKPKWVFPRLPVVPVLQLNRLSSSVKENPCEENTYVLYQAFQELINEKLLSHRARSLCVGEKSTPAISALHKLGFSNAIGIDKYPLFSIVSRGGIYKLPFKKNSFDFVFSGALDKTLVPALLVLEMERVLRPGSNGAILVSVTTATPTSLIKTATPVSSFLRNSDIINIRPIDSFLLVIFTKKVFNGLSSFGFRLPNECHSVENNKPFMKLLEPLVENKMVVKTRENISYLANLMDVTDRARFLFINLDSGDFNSSLAQWNQSLYPLVAGKFETYTVDHCGSVVSSLAESPTIHHDLSEKESSSKLVPPDAFASSAKNVAQGNAFVHWFEKNIVPRDFVVLKINVRVMGMEFLHKLFECGLICLVDEIFLHCSNGTNEQIAAAGDCCSNGANEQIAGAGDCIQLYKDLRNNGVFVHQW